MLQVLVGWAGPQMTALKLPESKHTYVLCPWDFFPSSFTIKVLLSFHHDCSHQNDFLNFWSYLPRHSPASVCFTLERREENGQFVHQVATESSGISMSGWSHRLCPEWITSEISTEAPCPSDIRLLWEPITLVLRKCIRKSIQFRLQA